MQYYLLAFAWYCQKCTRSCFTKNVSSYINYLEVNAVLSQLKRLDKKSENCIQVKEKYGRLFQILSVVTGTLTALSDGMQFGWTSPSLPLLQSSSSPIKIEDWQVVWLENIYMLGGLTGLPITVYLLDRFGRKKSMIIAAVGNLVSWILLATANSVDMLFAARFIAGMGSDVNFVATPTYIGEIADKEIRGSLGSVIQIMVSIGILLMYSIGPILSIRHSSMVGALFLVIQLVTFPFMPESPYYLLVKNKVDSARKSLQTLRRSTNVEKELNEIREVVLRENERRGKPLDLIRVKSNRKVFFILFVLCFAQNFGGVSVILMNLHSIIDDAASLVPASTATILFSFLLLVACFVSAAIIDKVGRKVLLCASSFLTGILLIVLASYFSAKNYGINVRAYNWVPIFVILTYSFTFKCGLGLVPVVMTTELYPTNVKAIGCAASDAMFLVAGAISLFFYHVLMNYFGMQVPFFVFGFCTLLACVYCIFAVPETKGKTLDEIQQILKGVHAETAGGSPAKIVATYGSNGTLQRKITVNSEINEFYH